MTKFEKFLKRKNSVVDVLSAYREEQPFPILAEKELTDVSRRINEIYGLKSLKKNDIISFLNKENYIELVKIKDFYIYKFGGEKIDSFDIAHSFFRSNHFSYFSALFINGLTLQIPKTIYLSYERTKTDHSEKKLAQSRIDEVFSKPPRVSHKIVELPQFDIRYLQSNNYKRIGLVPFRNIYWVTDLERTLIDITVRPFYAGGVVEVLNAYESAREKLDVIKLYEYYNSMQFTYPYHQAIGFYLQKAGYPESRYNLFKRRTSEFSFYLTYNILNKEYSTEWNLYFPRGL